MRETTPDEMKSRLVRAITQSLDELPAGAVPHTVRAQDWGDVRGKGGMFRVEIECHHFSLPFRSNMLVEKGGFQLEEPNFEREIEWELRADARGVKVGIYRDVFGNNWSLNASERGLLLGTRGGFNMLIPMDTLIGVLRNGKTAK
jgi:hypothetical protein